MDLNLPGKGAERKPEPRRAHGAEEPQGDDEDEQRGEGEGSDRDLEERVGHRGIVAQGPARGGRGGHARAGDPRAREVEVLEQFRHGEVRERDRRLPRRRRRLGVDLENHLGDGHGSAGGGGWGNPRLSKLLSLAVAVEAERSFS